MFAAGEEIFNVEDEFDEDMWDDSALIRNYERAYEASRSDTLTLKSDRNGFWNFKG